MSEDQKKDDNVKGDDYNKVVEAHNSVKTENEKLQKELTELKSKQETAEKDKETQGKIDEEKKAWDKEKADKEQQIAELQKKLEEKKDTTVVSKGVVSDATSGAAVPTQDSVKAMLDAKFPDRKTNPDIWGSAIQKYGYYKSPSTKQYSHDQLGQALSLHKGAISVNPQMVSTAARASKDDIIVNQ